MNVLLYRRCRPDDSADFTPACSGPCEQGRKECKTPAARQLPERTIKELQHWATVVAVAVSLAGAAIELLT